MDFWDKYFTLRPVEAAQTSKNIHWCFTYNGLTGRDPTACTDWNGAALTLMPPEWVGLETDGKAEDREHGEGDGSDDRDKETWERYKEGTFGTWVLEHNYRDKRGITVKLLGTNLSYPRILRVKRSAYLCRFLWARQYTSRRKSGL